MLMKNIVMLVTFIFLSLQFAYARFEKSQIDELDQYKIETPKKVQPIKRGVANSKADSKKQDREISSLKQSDSEVRYWKLEEHDLDLEEESDSDSID